MKYNRYLLLLLSLCISLCTRAQYNPDDPDEPGARPWRLTLKADPAKAESFNWNSVTNRAAGEQFYIQAYDHSGFKFVQWENEQGDVITKERGFDYTMPARHVTLTARYEYSPDTPDEPGQATIMRHLYLRSNPANGGSFNYGSANDVASGEQVTIRAYPNKHYSFRNWTKDGEIISTSAQFTYTMPERDATLTANFDYHFSPDNPYEPGTPEGSRCNLYAMREGVLPGQAYTYYIYMENVGIDATGFSLDVNFPQGFKVAQDAISLTSRANNHLLKVENTDDGGLRFIVSGTAAVEGVGGKILEIPVQVPDTATVGSVFPVILKNGLIFLSDGQQSAIGVRSGSLQILRSADEKPDSPDYMVSNLQTTNTSAMPGDVIHLSWQVSNQGSLAGSGGWTERLYLLSPNGHKVGIGTVSYDTSSLAVGAVVSRSTDIVLAQLPGIDGKVDLGVTIVPAVSSGEVADYQLNNSAQTADTPITIGKRLYLAVPQAPQQEGLVSTIRCQLSRSGNWTNSETFQLTKLTGDDRLSMPETVTIPRDQASAYFYIPFSNNAVCDADSIVSIRIEGQDGYEAVEGTFIINDDEQPPLQLAVSAIDINEGDTFQLTVSIDHPLSADLNVALTCDHPTRFSYPKTIILPQGQTTATVELTVIDDSNPSSTETVEFLATAEGYDKARILLVLYDNDVPDIDLELTPDIVSENAGANAVYAILKRTKVTNNKVTIRLTDDQTGKLVYPTTVVLEKGVTEKAITIGVVDNNLVDGESIVNLKAEVYISSCDCSVVGTKQGTVTRQLRILDNDGPTLTLTSSQSTIREGDDSGTEMTLTRNTQTSDKLIVMLHSEDEGVMLPTQVTIPAGEQSTTFRVRARTNDQQEGSRIVIIRANADGYNSGAVWLYITDTTLPDMSVRSIVLTPSTILAGDDYKADITIVNTGVVEIPARSTYTINTANQTFTMTIPEAIASNDWVTMSLNLKAPDASGSYTVEVECNKEHTFDEVQWLNNVYSVPLKVSPAYTYTVTTDRTSYQTEQTVKISGQATALKGTAQGITVEPYIVYHGTRKALVATTDADGRFETNYQLPAGVGGDFAVGVCAPGENTTEAAVTFGVYGMTRTSASYIKNYMYVGEPYTIKVPIKNISSLPLHHIKASFSDKESHYRITAKEIEVLDGYAEGEVELTMVSDVVTTTDNWERVWINLVSDEGATLNFVVYDFTANPNAELVLDQPVIKANITTNKLTTVPIVLTNKGSGKTGRITISVPRNQDFVILNTPQELPSLDHGDSTTISLTFNPAGLPTNVVQKGTLAINCENADGQLISYSLKVVGEDKGSLLVSVEDEFTIYGNGKGGHPLLAGASVQLKDYNTGVVLYTATTTEDGTALFSDIPEGYYTLFVTAPKHDSYIQYVLVSPAETTEHLATLSYQAISVSWNVEETTVEDQYEIVSEYTYETQVPVPVVVLDAPDELNLYDVEMGHELLYYIKVENQGLITAQNVCVSLPSHDDFLFTPLSEYAGFDLAAKQSVTIPVLVTYAPDGVQSRSRRAGEENTSKCHDYTWANWEWVCKANRTEWIGKVGKFLMRACDPDNPKPKDPKPDNEKTIAPTPPDKPGAGDPQLRYWKAEQPDLELLKEIVSTISCGLACFLPEPPDIPEPPQSPTLDDLNDWIHEHIPEKLKIPVCILEELVQSHNATNYRNHRSGNNSLRESYLNRLKLYLDFSSNQRNYYEELLNAPMLFDDNATVNLLASGLNTIIERISNWHSEGILYDKSVADIAQDAIALMPQRCADWYDFNLQSFVNRQINTWRLRDGMTVNGDNVCNITTLDTCQTNIVRCHQQIVDLGYLNLYDMLQSMKADIKEANSGTKNVCATVKLQIKQELTFTRQAFRGTLSIENTTENALSDIAALIQATNEDGTIATSREMQINLEHFDGFVEQSGGSYRLESGQTGTFTFLFIPTKYAATDHDVVYSFGGGLTFNNGEGVMTRELYPVSLIVRPSPELDLTYFMQRDIYADDPLTEEVEPQQPAEFALLINNKGYGDATDVRMVTHQPQIIENEKGLLIDFHLISSQLNGGSVSLSFGESIVNDFGTIPAKSQAYAQWWLTSTLLGHFIKYNVTANHVSSYGNEDLSLIGDATVHELIHGFTASDGVRGFLVNDVVDAEDMPDMIYFTDAAQKNVGRANINVNKIGNADYQLNVTSSMAGWSYASIPDPTDGKQKLVSVIRQSDGESIPVDNVWQTWCTLRDGKDPVHERRLHFVGNIPTEGQSYLLSFEARPDRELEVESFKGAPESDTEQKTELKEITVVFNKPIEASTFTTDDVSLRWQGIRLNDSDIIISQLSDTEYKLNLEKLTSQSGYYELTVLTKNIKDTEGFRGTKSSSLAWTQVVDGSGIHSLDANDQLSIIISPIPITDKMQISGNFKNIRNMYIYSPNGISKLQMHNVAPNTSIDVSQLKSGVYIVYIQTELGTYRTRVIKE